MLDGQHSARVFSQFHQDKKRRIARLKLGYKLEYRFLSSRMLSENVCQIGHHEAIILGNLHGLLYLVKFQGLWRLLFENTVPELVELLRCSIHCCRLQDLCRFLQGRLRNYLAVEFGGEKAVVREHAVVVIVIIVAS